MKLILFIVLLACLQSSVEAGTFTLSIASVQREILTLNFTNTGSISTVTLSGISLKCNGLAPTGWVLKLQGSNWLEINYTWCNPIPRYLTIAAGAVQTSTDSIVAVNNYMLPISTLLALYYFNESQNTSLTVAQHNQQTIRIKNYAPDPSYFGDLIRDTTYTRWNNNSVGLDFLIPQSASVTQNSRCRSETGLNNITYGAITQFTVELWIRENITPEPAFYGKCGNPTLCCGDSTSMLEYPFVITDTVDSTEVNSYFSNLFSTITYPTAITSRNLQPSYTTVGTTCQPYGYTAQSLNVIGFAFSSGGEGLSIRAGLIFATDLSGTPVQYNNIMGWVGSANLTTTISASKSFNNGQTYTTITGGAPEIPTCDSELCWLSQPFSIPTHNPYRNNSRIEVGAMVGYNSPGGLYQRVGFRGTVTKLAIYSTPMALPEMFQVMYDSVYNSIPTTVNSVARSTTTEDTPLSCDISGQIYDYDIATMGRPQTITAYITALPTRGSLWLNGIQLGSTVLPILMNSSITFLNDPFTSGSSYATVSFYASDGLASSRTLQWVIDVTHANHAPNATTGLSSYAIIGSQVTITLSGTDFDPGDIINNASITSFPTKGQLYTIGGALIQVLPFYLNGLQVVYKPFANATARTNDSFLFNVSDNHYAWSSAVAYTVVLQFNIQTNNPSGTTYEDQSLPLVFTDTDALNLTTTFVNYVYRLPYHGTLSQTNSTLPYPINNSAPFNYTPNQDFYGVDNFTFFATNGTSYYASDISLFSITVLSTDDIAVFLTDAQLPVRGKVPFDTANFSILWDDVDSDTTTFQVISICSYGLATNLHADLSQLFFFQGSGDQDPKFKYEGLKFPAIQALWNMSATCGTEGNKTITMSVINEDTTATITRTFYLYCDPQDTSSASSSPAWVIALIWLALAFCIIMCVVNLMQLCSRSWSAILGEKATTTDSSQYVKLNPTSNHFKRRGEIYYK